VLRAYDNIPVLSYVLLGGRCRQCKAGISIRYPIVEVVTMAVFIGHYLALGPDIILVPRLLFACTLIVLFAIDLEHHLLPNVITLPGIVVGLAFSAYPPGCSRPNWRPRRWRRPVAVGEACLMLLRTGRHGRRRRCWA
jgi:leader peptidase (prepilin peptidase)/N-methyltransferase